MDKKRKNEDNNINSNKKKHIVNWNEMISASSVRNYMLDDPLIDWLKYYSIDTINTLPLQKLHHNNNYNNSNNNNSINFTNFIMEQGNLFEKNVFDKLKENFNIIQVGESTDARSYDKYMETINYMKSGVDMIYQGVLHDYKNKLYGVPDLLVRSDKFNSIFNTNINIPKIGSYKLKTKYHYLVVDIKHSTINLNSNKDYIKDVNSIPAFKGQILIYNKILGEIQGYQSDLGFILCKNITFTKKNILYSSTNFMENIAIINYNGYDKDYNEKTSNAINWINRMRTDGHNWSLLPKPTVNELYPNMKNDKDDGYRKIKSELADRIHEITNIWWCSYTKRCISHSKKIFNWKDKRFNSKIIEIKDIKIAKTIDNIVEINRNSNNIIRTIDLVKENNWREDNNIMEFYIDFETINSNIGQLNINNDNDIIFMVCIGWNNYDNWEYQSFMINKNNNEEELKMINNMWELIDNKMKEFNKVDYKFIHWSNAEITFYNKFLHKHPFKLFNDFKSFDLYKLFLDNNIVIRGALNFSLKNVANAMYKNGLINSCWDTNSSCNNGLQAMYLAYNLYKNNDYIDDNNSIMKEIIRYNIIDCQVMWEMLSYLRNNY